MSTEAQRQGRAAFAAGKPRNDRWPAEFLAAYDQAEADEMADMGEASTKRRLGAYSDSQAIAAKEENSVD